MKKKQLPLLKVYAVCISVLCLLCAIAFAMVFHKSGYDRKLLVKYGLAEPVAEANWAVGGWNNTLMKLDYDADVVFLGDSITWSSDFREWFPEKKIVNLGYYGDTLMGMIDRVPGVAAVKPEKVFVLGGINGLTDQNGDACMETYIQLLDELETALPESEIFIQSLLPISAEREQFGIHNSTISDFNLQLAAIARERGMGFVDLYTLYEKDGELNPSLTSDGLHLLPEAYGIWAAAIAEYIE